MTVKMHSGGVSRSGSSRVAGWDVVPRVKPDIVGHISGGPIPAPDEDIVAIMAGLPSAKLEVCSSNNYRATKLVVDELTAAWQAGPPHAGHRHTGRDRGDTARDAAQHLLSGVGVRGRPTGRPSPRPPARPPGRTGLRTGVLAEGMPADLLVLGPITGSRAQDGLECFALGDLPGIAAVLVDGVPLVHTRSEQTPPPSRSVSWRGQASAHDPERPAVVEAHSRGCC